MEGRKVFYQQGSVRAADEDFSKTEVKQEITETGVPENRSLQEFPDILRKALEFAQDREWGSLANSCEQGSSAELKSWFNGHGYIMDEDSKS